MVDSLVNGADLPASQFRQWNHGTVAGLQEYGREVFGTGPHGARQAQVDQERIALQRHVHGACRCPFQQRLLSAGDLLHR